MAISRCPECNCKILDQPLSCPKCGRPFTMNSAFNDVPPPNAGIYTPNDNIYTQDITVSSKNRLTALLFCLFLGYFGAHRFYVGKTKSGIVMIVMSILIIPNIILWIVDFIRILSGTFTDGEELPLKRWEQ